MTRHASKNVVQYHHGGIDMGPFVEHDALGSLAHCGIGDLSPGRFAGACQLVENLGCPNHWEVCGLAQPKNLLLHLGETLVTSLYRQVTSGDHDSDEWRTHGVKQDLWQASKRRSRFDLENQSQVFGPDSFEVPVYVIDVALVAQK
jgi:hypothetical protein